jgi:hypothetical protein
LTDFIRVLIFLAQKESSTKKASLRYWSRGRKSNQKEKTTRVFDRFYQGFDFFSAKRKLHKEKASLRYWSRGRKSNQKEKIT